MKKLPKNGVKAWCAKRKYWGNSWVCYDNPEHFSKTDGPTLSCRIFSEERAKELLRIEKEHKLLVQCSGEYCKKCGWNFVIPSFGCYKCKAEVTKAKKK